MEDPKYKPGQVVLYTKKYTFMDTIQFAKYVDEVWYYSMEKTNKGCPAKESEIIKIIN